MKKLSLFVAILLATSTAGLLPAKALTLTSTVTSKSAIPNDPDFVAGYNDGRARGAALGQGSQAVHDEITYAIANEQEAAANGDTAGANYWWGYRVGLNRYY